MRNTITVFHDISKQIQQRVRIDKIFARWHLAIATTSNNCYIHHSVDKIVKLSLAYGFKLTDFICCCYAVCPVPMNKEEEEFIKERERNRELMEEIAREIEITCLGKFKMTKKK